jgi:hypothetical protein
MTDVPTQPYNTNLSKAQGLVAETIELLSLWDLGMDAVALTERARSVGALGRATSARMSDVISRGFAQRYLIESAAPASFLKHLLEAGVDRGVLRQIIFIYTARHNLVFRDFVTSVYWRKAAAGSEEITKADARDFLERAAATGHITPRWADSMMERVSRYLLGTLEDFQMIVENRTSRRRIRPPAIIPGVALFLAYDLHFHGIDPGDLPRHADWALFGLSAGEVLQALNQAAAAGHLQLQNAGQFLRIEWRYADMNQVIHAITH